MNETLNQYTPLHGLHLELGARMAPFAGYDMPIHYRAGVLAEHLHTRKFAGVFDVSHMGQALIEGSDHGSVAAFLETLCPADLVNLAPGRQRYTQLLNDDGGIVDDLMITRAARSGWSAKVGCQRFSQVRRLRPYPRPRSGGRSHSPAWRSSADRSSGSFGGGDLGPPCAVGGARDDALHERQAGADRRSRGVRHPLGLYGRRWIRNLACLFSS